MSYYKEPKRRLYGNQIAKARKVQARRSSWAKHVDERLKAPKAKNVKQWLSAPNRFDLPTVDENMLSLSQFKEKFIEAVKNHPEWKTTSEEDRQKLLSGFRSRQDKVQQLYDAYCDSGKSFEDWFKSLD